MLPLSLLQNCPKEGSEHSECPDELWCSVSRVRSQSTCYHRLHSEMFFWFSFFPCCINGLSKKITTYNNKLINISFLVSNVICVLIAKLILIICLPILWLRWYILGLWNESALCVLHDELLHIIYEIYWLSFIIEPWVRFAPRSRYCCSQKCMFLFSSTMYKVMMRKKNWN